jgi:hypothetical protein
MALPVTIPNEFASATASIPLSQLDTNFTTLANAVNGISDGSETLANASVTVLTAGTANVTTLNTSGQVVFNDAGADVDFRVEGDTDANLLFVDASADTVGIGTSSPSYPLQVIKNQAATTNISVDNNTGNAASHASLILHTGGASSGDPFVYFYNEITDWSIGCDNSDSDKFKISKSSTLGTNDYFNIDSSGNVGIGITNQNEKLVVNGAIRSTNNAAGATATADSGVFYFIPTADAPSDPRTVLQGVGTASVGASVVFYTGTSASNSERMRVTSDGYLRLAGGGIQFNGDTAAANALDDYEEGTWTPVLQGSSTAGTYVYDTDRTAGVYRKVGNLVQVWGVYRVSSVTSAGTGDARIYGLPFSALAVTGSWARIPGLLRMQTGPTLANNGLFVFAEATTYLGMGLQAVDNWSAIAVTDADFVDTVWFFQCSYFTA